MQIADKQLDTHENFLRDVNSMKRGQALEGDFDRELKPQPAADHQSQRQKRKATSRRQRDRIGIAMPWDAIEKTLTTWWRWTSSGAVRGPQRPSESMMMSTQNGLADRTLSSKGSDR